MVELALQLCGSTRKQLSQLQHADMLGEELYDAVTLAQNIPKTNQVRAAHNTAPKHTNVCHWTPLMTVCENAMLDPGPAAAGKLHRQADSHHGGGRPAAG